MSVIRPETQPGWSAGVEVKPGDELDVEMDPARGVLVLRYRKRLGLPVYIPVPVPHMLRICGQLLISMGEGAVVPTPWEEATPHDEN